MANIWNSEEIEEIKKGIIPENRSVKSAVHVAYKLKLNSTIRGIILSAYNEERRNKRGSK